uniref:HTH_Tnp_Tc3_1 domain-containing protein n=1 Tax=Haemonchus contortus TaxID=6289 RepID=A0A7I4Z0J8_HAECO
MPKGRRLSSTEQSQILSLRQADHSNKAIAEQLVRSRRCIDGFVENSAAYGQAHEGGRPLKLTRADHRLIARLASNSTMSANQIRARLSLNVSTSTSYSSSNILEEGEDEASSPSDQ